MSARDRLSMTNTRYEPEERRQTALAMLDALDGDHDGPRRLAVRCRRSHEVADVYETAGVLVYAARPRGRGHGRRDRPDVAHHGHEHGVVFADLLGESAGGDPTSCFRPPASAGRICCRGQCCSTRSRTTST
jgi:hypothetical protein